MSPGIFIAINSGERDVMLAILGSLGVVIGTVLFVVMFAGKVALARSKA